MPCNQPMPAWRNSQSGIVSLGREIPDSTQLQLPCGGCLGCRKAQAQAWTLRCLLESQDHERSIFTTLTYDGGSLPPTLQRRDIQLFYKRLRKRVKQKIRHFTCGEYGEQNNRPHYHSIIFGASLEDTDRINLAWAQGHTKTESVTPRRIAYTAGYVAKKYFVPKWITDEYVDYTTGEIYEWQQPFLQMSRRPGIGNSARRHTQSWRDFAVLNGTRIPVPKYLHSAWEEIATTDEKEERDYEKYLRSLTKERMTAQQLAASEEIAKAANKLTAERRKL